MWMSVDQQMPITLAIVDRQMSLPVVNMSGREALNEPYSFFIDVLSENPQFDLASLERRMAYLSLGDRVVHGQIVSASGLYASNGISLNRIHLAPSLCDLAQRAQRRVYQGLSVPQIIVQLLTEHGMQEKSWQFEPLVGVYPPREFCVQHDETDLHLLQRLCEEEGIHFRFQHEEDGHTLIFADDPACFPLQPVAVQFHAPTLRARFSRVISSLTEYWALQRVDPSQWVHRSQWSPQTSGPVADAQQAANQRFEPSSTSSLPTEEQAHDRQVSARTLERERCERRRIYGLSAQLPLSCGQIIQVLDHPEEVFNDQWLLTEVVHAARQPQALKGRDRNDVAAILDLIKAPARIDGTWPKGTEIAPFSRGYRNSFRVMPWEMPYRPPLRHSKPLITEYQTATLRSDCAQTREQLAYGRLPVRFEPQPMTDAPERELCAPLSLCAAQVAALRSGTTVRVGNFDNDPDRPVICALAPGQSSSHDVTAQQHIDNDPLHTPQTIHVDLQDSLHLTANRPIRLSTATATMLICEERITYTGRPRSLVDPDSPRLPASAPAPGAPLFFETDLRLTEQPGLRGAPLSNRLWYIVRMREPGLEHLARLHPEHFLFEGKTDEQGYCGLSGQQLRDLAAAYRATPDSLCLVHPGQCIALQTWFQSNWPPRLHQAFLQYQ
jgi:type VI secretion system secreted protein VgrG